MAQKGYEKYITDKYPDKKLAVLSCMDTRLTELLPAALGLKNGDAKIIKNAGDLVLTPLFVSPRGESLYRYRYDHSFPSGEAGRGVLFDSETGELEEIL